MSKKFFVTNCFISSESPHKAGVMHFPIEMAYKSPTVSLILQHFIKTKNLNHEDSLPVIPSYSLLLSL